MAITGTHLLFYTTEADQLRATLRDMFGFKHVDAGHGWLIFRTPPSEVGVHPAEEGNEGTHSVSFMCDDINKTIAELRAKGVNVDPQTRDEGYGVTTMMHLPGGCDVMLYQPRHPIAADIKKVALKTASAFAREKKTAPRASARRTRLKSSARAAAKRPRPRARKAGRRR